MDESNQSADEIVHYHVEGSHVVHKDRDCYHLDGSENVEEITGDVDNYRTCRQCWLNNLSPQERLEREQRGKRSRKTKITIRGRL